MTSINASVMSNLRNLRKLEVYGKASPDYQFLANFRQLEELRIIQGSGQELNFISGLKNIKKLTFEDFDAVDLTKISVLTDLEQLDLGASPSSFSDLTPLNSLPKLKRLRFSGNPSALALSQISNLKSLVTLQLERVPNIDLIGLDKFVNLESLTLENGQKDGNCDLFKRLEKLRLLQLSTPRTASVVPCLGALGKLKSLYIYGNANLQSIESIAKLSSLEKLWISGSGVTSIDGLRGLKELKYLWAASTQLSSLLPLEGNSRLRTIDIAQTPLILNGLNPSNCPANAKSTPLASLCR